MMPGTTMTESSAKSAGALISVAAVIVIIFGMQAAKVLLVPFLLAAFLALIAVRPMLWLQRRKIPSVLAALLIVAAMLLPVMPKKSVELLAKLGRDEEAGAEHVRALLRDANADGVTLDGDVYLTQASASNFRVSNGLTLNGTLAIGDPSANV